MNRPKRRRNNTAPPETTHGEYEVQLTVPQLVSTSSEVEQILRLSKSSVHALLQSGRLRSVRVGRKYLIPRDAIEAFLQGEQ